MSMRLVQTVTAGSGGIFEIEFTNIPQTARDLLVVLSLRSVHSSFDTVGIYFNGSQANLSYRALQGNGSSASTLSGTYRAIGFIPSAGQTSNTFGNTSVYITNYSSSTNKSFSVDNVTETNGTTSYQELSGWVWSNTAAITSLKFDTATSGLNLAQHSSISLYTIG